MRKLIVFLLLFPVLALAQVYPPKTSGSFTGTVSGYAAPPTTTVVYAYQGPLVTLSIATVSGTSNATTMTVTGMPADIQPSTLQVAIGLATDNGAEVIAPVSIGTDGTITFYKSIWSGAFTGSGTKGVRQATITYLRY